MSPINPIQGPTPPIVPRPADGAGAKKGASPQNGFGEMLRNCVEKVDSSQQASSQAIQDLLTGKTQDSLSVVAAVAKADLSFKLLLELRNKLVEAYKATMSMGV